jgi:hypothetical protein
MKGDGVLVGHSKRLCLHMATRRVQTRMNIQCVVGFRIPDCNDGTIEDVRPHFVLDSGTVHVGCWILVLYMLAVGFWYCTCWLLDTGTVHAGCWILVLYMLAVGSC